MKTLSSSIQQGSLLFEHDVFKVTSTLVQVTACPPSQRFRKKTGSNNRPFQCHTVYKTLLQQQRLLAVE
jgi:hypothetical protein